MVRGEVTDENSQPRNPSSFLRWTALAMFLALMGGSTLYAIKSDPANTTRPLSEILRTMWQRMTGQSKTMVCVLRQEDGDICSLSTYLIVFETIEGRFPTQDEGLLALIANPPVGQARHRRTLLEKLPTDSQGRAYQYRIPATRSKTSFDLFSLGADGVPSDDDIGNW